MNAQLRTAGLIAALAGACAAAACKKEPVAPPAAAIPAVTTDAPGCDAARAYVAGRLGRFADKSLVTVDTAAPDMSFLAGVKAADLTKRYNPGLPDPAGWPKDPPSQALAEAWVAARPASPFAACVDFGKVVETAGVAIGKVAAGEKPKTKDGLPRTQMNFAMPVISADGAEALLLESGSTGQGSRASGPVHLRKDKAGVWQEADFVTLQIN